MAVSQAQTAAERRKHVMVGDLPETFLQLAPCSSDEQVAYDAQAALALQQRYNTRVAGVPFASAFVPPNTRGRLSVTIAQAKLSKNYGLVRMDPYCRLRVATAVFETPTDPNGAKTPHWNRTIHCYLPNGVDSIYIEVFDERAFTIDERIAWGHIMIPEAVFNGETIDDWYCLSGQQGEGKEGMINIVISLAVSAPEGLGLRAACMPARAFTKKTRQPVEGPPVTYVPMNQPILLQPGQAYTMPGQPVIQQPVIPVGPLFTDQDVKELKEMFPNVEEEVIKSVLEETRGNKTSTVNSLLAMTSD